jgi:hypothetical protein
MQYLKKLFIHKELKVPIWENDVDIAPETIYALAVDERVPIQTRAMSAVLFFASSTFFLNDGLQNKAANPNSLTNLNFCKTYFHFLLFTPKYFI